MGEEKMGVPMETREGQRTGEYKILFKKHFKILVYTFNQAGRTLDCIEERMQNADKSWWSDVKIYRSKDVPRRVKCKGVVEHVFIVFCFGSENWSWSQAILDRKNGNKGHKPLVQIHKERG